MKYSEKQPHICLNTKNMFRNSCTHFLFRSSRTFYLISFRKSRTFFKKHELFSEAAAQFFTVAVQNTLCEDFHNLSIVMKTFLMDNFIKPKVLHIPWLMLLFHPPVQGYVQSYLIVSVQGYLMLIDCVHFMLLILKQHLFPVYCFTIKQAGLIIIKHKAFSNHTLFCTFAALLLHSFCPSFYTHTSLLLRQQTLS